MKDKDPAFLFYAKDFYEGTRTMLPKERACYIDLMIYQHQHGYIPNDMERMSMYCSGIDEATLQATLQAKFKQEDKGWYNAKLRKVVDDRIEYSSRQSDNGILGQFFKKAKSVLKQKDFKELREYIFGSYTKEKLISKLKEKEASHEGVLEALLKHLANANANAIEEVNKGIISTTHPLLLWIKDNCKRVSQLQNLLTEKEADRLIEDFDKRYISHQLLAMENWKSLTKNNASVNLTFRNWAAREDDYENWKKKHPSAPTGTKHPEAQ